MLSFFFFNDTATTEIYTLSLHDALPICVFPGSHVVPSAPWPAPPFVDDAGHGIGIAYGEAVYARVAARAGTPTRSEEHTSELQSRPHLVCRLLLEKKHTL